MPVVIRVHGNATSDRNEFAYDSERALRHIRNHAMAARRKPNKAYQIGGDRCRKLRLTLDGDHGIVFTPEHKCRTLQVW